MNKNTQKVVIQQNYTDTYTLSWMNVLLGCVGAVLCVCALLTDVKSEPEFLPRHEHKTLTRHGVSPCCCSESGVKKRQSAVSELEEKLQMHIHITVKQEYTPNSRSLIPLRLSERKKGCEPISKGRRRETPDGKRTGQGCVSSKPAVGNEKADCSVYPVRKTIKFWCWGGQPWLNVDSEIPIVTDQLDLSCNRRVTGARRSHPLLRNLRLHKENSHNLHSPRGVRLHPRYRRCWPSY